MLINDRYNHLEPQWTRPSPLIQVVKLPHLTYWISLPSPPSPSLPPPFPPPSGPEENHPGSLWDRNKTPNAVGSGLKPQPKLNAVHFKLHHPIRIGRHASKSIIKHDAITNHLLSYCYR